MTPLENELLQRLGKNYLQLVATLSIYGFFYGVFVVLFFASVVIFMRRGFSNCPAGAMFVATVINFLLSTLYTATQVAAFVVPIREALILNIDYPLSEKPKLVKNALRNVRIIFYWTVSLSVLLSDLIVIWRAWALFPDRQWVIIIPFILWIVAVAITVGDRIWISIPNDYGQLNSKLDTSLAGAGFILSMVTNAVATMMIAYKLWGYRRSFVRTLGLRRRKSPVQTILILVVESGLFFLAFQIVFLVLAAVESPYSVEAYVFAALYYSLSAMYPTVVIVIVETQRSMADICEIIPWNASTLAAPVVSEARTATLGHLSFAHSTMNNEAESQFSRTLQSRGGQEHGLEAILEVKELEVGSSS